VVIADSNNDDDNGVWVDYGFKPVNYSKAFWSLPIDIKL